MTKTEQADIVCPTRQRIAKAGARYQGALVDARVRRPYARAVPSLDWLYQRGSLTQEQHAAGDRVRHYMAGSTRARGLTASYGDQRHVGTLASQESDTSRLAGSEWHTYCYDKVLAIGRSVMSSTSLLAWQVMCLVIDDDMTMEDAARRCGCHQTTAMVHFKRGLDALARSDYAQQHPGA